MFSCRSRWLTIGAVLSGLAVACGAFAAHGLDGHFHKQYAGRQFEKKIKQDGVETVVSTTPLAQKYLADFKTGAEYQMYHGLALLAVGILASFRPSKLLNLAGCCFVAGCCGFSGGLYVYTIADLKWVGMLIVPLGGTLFLVGWGALAAAVCPCAGSVGSPLVQLPSDPSAAARSH